MHGNAMQDSHKAKEVAPKVLNVLLLGRTGCGKSTAGNHLISEKGNNAIVQVQEGAVRREWPADVTIGVDQASYPYQSIHFITKERAAETVTQECELMANTITGFRVMDTRGFAPSDTVDPVYLANLQIMREVEAISSKKKLVYHRVLYFLPERNIPERAGGFLQEELEGLWHFYGDTIFRNMVIVVTAHPRSKSIDPDIDNHFEDGAANVVQQIFVEALEKVIHSHEDARLPPCPDIVFIPLRATSESVAAIVRNAQVCERNGIRLKFQKTTCSKCANVIHITRRKGIVSIVGVEIEEGRISIPEKSKCHPAFIPKHTKLAEQFRGPGHTITLRTSRVAERQTAKPVQPSSFSMREERCSNCDHFPNIEGCLRVGEMYQGVRVQHHHDQ